MPLIVKVKGSNLEWRISCADGGGKGHHFANDDEGAVPESMYDIGGGGHGHSIDGGDDKEARPRNAVVVLLIKK